jgi:hypothetical protein
MTAFIMFNRQHKRNGIVSSVCILCEQTIATGRSLLELVPWEIAHRCDAAQANPSEYQERPHA